MAGPQPNHGCTLSVPARPRRFARLLTVLALILSAVIGTAVNSAPAQASPAAGPLAVLSAGQRLAPGAWLASPNRFATLHMQLDGNLVLRRGAAAVWNTHTAGHLGSAARILGNGQLVVTAPGGRVLWHTGLAGARARLSVSPNYNLYLRNAAGAVVWQALLPKPVARPVVAAPTAATFAGRLLAMWGGKVTGLPAVYSDLLATSRNQTITNRDSCGRAAQVDIRLVRFLTQVTGAYRIKINNIITGHGCDAGQHPSGRSVDIATATSLATGVSTSFGGRSGPNNLNLNRVFASYVSTILPTGAGLGQSAPALASPPPGSEPACSSFRTPAPISTSRCSPAGNRAGTRPLRIRAAASGTATRTAG